MMMMMIIKIVKLWPCLVAAMMIKLKSCCWDDLHSPDHHAGAVDLVLVAQLGSGNRKQKVHPRYLFGWLPYQLSNAKYNACLLSGCRFLEVLFVLCV